MSEVAAYLNVTFQRVAQMRLEGKLPRAGSGRRHRPHVEAGHDRAMG